MKLIHLKSELEIDPEKVTALAKHSTHLKPEPELLFFKECPERAQNLEMQLWNNQVLAKREATCSM